jgi:organic radical activating enzyme
LQNKNSGRDLDLYPIIMEYLPQIDGITFSGGEPLFQEEELLNLLKKLPKSLDKMLFTGYYKEELNDIQLECYNKFDLVVEGRFEIEKMGNFLWRGSSNQIFTSPTKKYESILKKLYDLPSAGLEIKIKNNEIIFYGIPTNKNEIELIKKQLNLNGIVF